MDDKQTKRAIDSLLRARRLRNDFCHDAKDVLIESVQQLTRYESDIDEVLTTLNDSRVTPRTVFSIRWAHRLVGRGCRIVTPYFHRRSSESARQAISYGSLPLGKERRVELRDEEPIFERSGFNKDQLQLLDDISEIAHRYLILQKALIGIAQGLNDEPNASQENTRQPVLFKARAERLRMVDQIAGAALSAMVALEDIEEDIDDLRYPFNLMRNGPGKRKFGAYRLFWERPKGDGWLTQLNLVQVTGVGRSGKVFYKQVGTLVKSRKQILTKKALKSSFYRGKANEAHKLFLATRELAEDHIQKTMFLLNIKKLGRYINDES